MREMCIRDRYKDNGYLMDTHTAVAYKVYEDYRKTTGDETPTIIASTASAYKFAESVAKSIGPVSYTHLIKSRRAGLWCLLLFDIRDGETGQTRGAPCGQALPCLLYTSRCV